MSDDHVTAIDYSIYLVMLRLKTESTVYVHGFIFYVKI